MQFERLRVRACSAACRIASQREVCEGFDVVWCACCVFVRVRSHSDKLRGCCWGDSSDTPQGPGGPLRARDELCMAKDASYHGDEPGATPANTPRMCTDCLWLVVFLLGCGGLFGAWSFASVRGDPRWLSALPDSEGKLCGSGGHGKLLLVCSGSPGQLDLKRRVCVDECPAAATENSVAVVACSPSGGVYPSTPVAELVCVPTETALRDSLKSNTYVRQALEISEVPKAWPLLAAAGGMALLLSFMYICFLEMCSTCLAFLGLTVLIVSSGVLGAFLIGSSHSGSTAAVAYVGDIQCFVLGVVCCSVSFLLCCLLCCNCEQLGVAAASVKEACQCILEEPCLLLEPCFALVWRGAVFLPLLVGLLWVLSCGRRPRPDEAHGGGPQEALGDFFLNFEHNELAVLCYYVGMMLWIMELCHAVSVFVLAYSVELWYFDARRTGEGLSCCGLITAYVTCCHHHLGTLVLGSFTIAMCRCLRAPLGLLAWAATPTDDNPVAECLAHFCCCCVGIFEHFLRGVSKVAYLDVALNSIGFCEASRHAAEVLAHESVAEVALGPATPMLQLAGVGGISTAGGLFAMWLSRKWLLFSDPSSDRFVEDPTAIAVVAAAICFLITWPFLHIFDTVSATILYCMATEEMRASGQDEEEEVKDDRPFCNVGYCFGSSSRQESERLLG